MPKIVDRANYRMELIAKAVPIFRSYGYSAVGMREIAKEIGISKSALYHYFPTKKDLFAACCAWVTRASDFAPRESGHEHMSLADIMKLVKEADTVFRDDLRLLLDYSRTLTLPELAGDQNLQLAFQPYHDVFIEQFGTEAGRLALYSTLGALVVRAVGRDDPSLGTIESILEASLPKSEPR